MGWVVAWLIIEKESWIVGTWGIQQYNGSATIYNNRIVPEKKHMSCMMRWWLCDQMRVWGVSSWWLGDDSSVGGGWTEAQSSTPDSHRAEVPPLPAPASALGSRPASQFYVTLGVGCTLYLLFRFRLDHTTQLWLPTTVNNIASWN